ncbi:MAG TPA: SAM-dependent chlorinase/fluorinase [Phototrophicaceae bacterium]|nr:SAM-dependent chlorinase/fluorinase [Phototrophicaceae bacterium]
MSRLIALLTDFGTTDTYVGVMKGVMLGINPDLQFVDLTHAIEPQNIKQAAFVLLNSYRYFPKGTVFLVVVDPGVGSLRKSIAAQVDNYAFVAPDNGVLSYVLRELGEVRAVELTNPAYRLSATSRTFHGRDIFAPAAAHLASGVEFEQFGNWVDKPITLSEPLLKAEKTISGEVLHLDHFGTLVTSIGLLQWDEARQLTLTPRFGDASQVSFAADKAIVTVGNQQIGSIDRTYAEVEKGEVLALIGSSGYLEVSINGGSFAERFGAHIGDLVTVQIG